MDTAVFVGSPVSLPQTFVNGGVAGGEGNAKVRVITLEEEDVGASVARNGRAYMVSVFVGTNE